MKIVLFCPVLLLALAPPARAQSASATGISRAFNPAISANGLFLGRYTSDENAGRRDSTGTSIQEMELQLSSFVDTYLKADLIFSLPEGKDIEVEEGYVTSLDLPYNLTLKVGKFFAEFGRHNRLHTHQFPFLDPPLVNERLLGDEGLNESGVALSALLPAPWYLEVVGQVLDGDNELFASPNGEDLLYLSHLKNFWDLGDAATLELGASYAAGNDRAKKLSSLLGGDLTLKWRRSIYHSLTWQSEYLYSRQNLPGGRREVGGFYSLAQFQFLRRWWLEGRYDLFGLPREVEGRDFRISGLLAFVPSEFSALRFQYNHLDESGKGIDQLMAQLNITIGSHPAHHY